MSRIKITLTVPQYVDLTNALQSRVNDQLDALTVTNPDDLKADLKKLHAAVDLFANVAGGHEQFEGSSLYTEEILVNNRWSKQAVYELSTNAEAKRQFGRSVRLERTIKSQQQGYPIEALRMLDDTDQVIAEEELS
jgi:hypothetical protein